MVPYDPPYAGPRVEACGYAKAKDVFSYDYDVQNAPETIGHAVSSGCIRLVNDDVIDLYNRVPLGTKVVVQHQ